MHHWYAAHTVHDAKVGRLADRIVDANAVLAGDHLPPGRALIYDDDSYYLGPVLALALRARGYDVTLVTPEGRAGAWGSHTQELFSSTRGMLEAGVEIVTNVKGNVIGIHSNIER